MKQMFVHAGKAPDFLMTYDRVEIMHIVTVCFSRDQGPKQTVKIIARSFQKVLFDFQSLLNAKTSHQLWSIVPYAPNAEDFEIVSDCVHVRARLHFPSKLPSDIRESLRLIFFQNLCKFCRI
jgi:hypothetical protein